MFTDEEIAAVETVFSDVGQALNNIKISADSIQSFKSEGQDSLEGYLTERLPEIGFVEGQGLYIHFLISWDDARIYVSAHPALVEMMGDKYFTSEQANLMGSKDDMSGVLYQKMRDAMNDSEYQQALTMPVMQFHTNYTKMIGFTPNSGTPAPTEAQVVENNQSILDNKEEEPTIGESMKEVSSLFSNMILILLFLFIIIKVIKLISRGTKTSVANVNTTKIKNSAEVLVRDRFSEAVEYAETKLGVTLTEEQKQSLNKSMEEVANDSYSYADTEDALFDVKEKFFAHVQESRKREDHIAEKLASETITNSPTQSKTRFGSSSNGSSLRSDTRATKVEEKPEVKVPTQVEKPVKEEDRIWKPSSDNRRISSEAKKPDLPEGFNPMLPR